MFIPRLPRVQMPQVAPFQNSSCLIHLLPFFLPPLSAIFQNFFEKLQDFSELGPKIKYLETGIRKLWPTN